MGPTCTPTPRSVCFQRSTPSFDRNQPFRISVRRRRQRTPWTSLDNSGNQKIAQGKEGSNLEYVNNVRERMETAWELVRANMEQAQETQWYDLKARQINLQAGDKVLVLLPFSIHKLLAQWQGPYLVKQRIGRVNNEIVMPEQRKPNVLFHVNILKKWEEREASLGEALHFEKVTEGEDDAMEIPAWNDSSKTELQLDPDIVDQEQGQELKRMLAKFEEVISDHLGQTQLVQHRIMASGGKPIRQHPYWIPGANTTGPT